MAKLDKDEAARYFSDHADIQNRTIYIGSGGYEEGEEQGVNGLLAQNVIKALHIMDHNEQSDEKPIVAQLNCIGGDYYHGMAIYDALSECKNHVTIKVYGQASSMGSIILQAGDERILSKHSVLLLHYGHFSCSDVSISSTNNADFEKKCRSIMEDIYLSRIKEKHPRYRRDKIVKLLQFDSILTAEEAVELGLADKILE